MNIIKNRNCFARIIQTLESIANVLKHMCSVVQLLWIDSANVDSILTKNTVFSLIHVLSSSTQKIQLPAGTTACAWTNVSTPSSRTFLCHPSHVVTLRSWIRADGIACAQTASIANVSLFTLLCSVLFENYFLIEYELVQWTNLFITSLIVPFS